MSRTALCLENPERHECKSCAHGNNPGGTLAVFTLPWERKMAAGGPPTASLIWSILFQLGVKPAIAFVIKKSNNMF